MAILVNSTTKLGYSLLNIHFCSAEHIPFSTWQTIAGKNAGEVSDGMKCGHQPEVDYQWYPMTPKSSPESASDWFLPPSICLN